MLLICCVLGVKDLRAILNLIPGSVTPFGLVNDLPVPDASTDPKVTYFLDRKALTDFDHLCFHPNACNCSVVIHKDDFVRYIETACHHKVNLLDFSVNPIKRYAI